VEEQQKKIVIISAVTVLAIFLLWALFSKPKAPKDVFKGGQQHVAVKTGKPTKTPVEKKTESFPSGAVSSPSFSGNVSPFSESEQKLMQERVKETNKLIETAAQDWLFSMANDETLSAKTREKYKIKMNKNYVEGSNAQSLKDYPRAIKSYFQVLKSEESTDVTKYFALNNIKTIAIKMNNMELFIEVSKAYAKLIATADLSTIGVKKTDDQIEWIETFEKIYRAKKDPAALESLVQEKQKDNPEIPRDEIIQDIMVEAAEYEAIFKELMQS